MTLPNGLYDLLLTEGLARSLAGLDPLHAPMCQGNVDLTPVFPGRARCVAREQTYDIGSMGDRQFMGGKCPFKYPIRVSPAKIGVLAPRQTEAAMPLSIKHEPRKLATLNNHRASPSDFHPAES